MKYWNVIIKDNCSYEEANHYAKNHRPVYITREEWGGVHFYNVDGRYCILLKDGKVIIDAEDVWCKDKNDWMVVTITEDALARIEEYTKIL